MPTENKKVSQLHPRLYHYTNQRGLDGILDSQSLWATHFTSLNDSSEMNHMRATFVSHVRPTAKDVVSSLYRESSAFKRAIQRKGGIGTFADQVAKTFVDIFYDVTFGTRETTIGPYFDPFIVSFCSHDYAGEDYERENGLLSQWRGYGGDGGYAIVFDTRKLEDILNRESQDYWHTGAYIGDVVYEGDNAGFSEEFSELLKLSKKNLPLQVRGKDWTPGEMYMPFVDSVSRFKHRGFREEREVRMLFSPLPSKLRDATADADPSFDSSRKKSKKILRMGAGPRNYIKLFADDPEPLPIVEIIVGPHPEKEARAASLSRKLKETSVAVRCSDTPYVPIT
jgi:hypothetical protein